jgi:hypothetical protein
MSYSKERAAKQDIYQSISKYLLGISYSICKMIRPLAGGALLYNGEVVIVIISKETDRLQKR